MFLITKQLSCVWPVFGYINIYLLVEDSVMLMSPGTIFWIIVIYILLLTPVLIFLVGHTSQDSIDLRLLLNIRPLDFDGFCIQNFISGALPVVVDIQGFEYISAIFRLNGSLCCLLLINLLLCFNFEAILYCLSGGFLCNMVVSSWPVGVIKLSALLNSRG